MTAEPTREQALDVAASILMAAAALRDGQRERAVDILAGDPEADNEEAGRFTCGQFATAAVTCDLVGIVAACWDGGALE